MEIIAISLTLIGLLVMLVPVFRSDPAGPEPAYGEISNYNLYFRACFAPEKIFRFILRDKDDILDYTHYMLVCFGFIFGFMALVILAPYIGDLAGGDPLGTVVLYLLIVFLPVAFFYGCSFLLYHIGRIFGGIAYTKGTRLTLTVSLFPVLVAGGIFVEVVYLFTAGVLVLSTGTGLFVTIAGALVILTLIIWHWVILVTGVRLFHSISHGQAFATVGMIAMLILAGGFLVFGLVLGSY